MPAFPSQLPARVEVFHERAQALVRSPFSLAQQSQAHPGRAWRVAVTMQTSDVENAAVMIAFLESLDGYANTFTLDLTPYCPGITTGTLTFRLISPTTNWTCELGVLWDFSFAAVEVI